MDDNPYQSPPSVPAVKPTPLVADEPPIRRGWLGLLFYFVAMHLTVVTVVLTIFAVRLVLSRANFAWIDAAWLAILLPSGIAAIVWLVRAGARLRQV